VRTITPLLYANVQSVIVLSANLQPVIFQSVKFQSCKFSYPNRGGDWNFQDWKITDEAAGADNGRLIV